MGYTLKTHHLTKKYNGIEVVSDVTMNIEKGEIYGLLGPNGAGKSTIMKMITQLISMTKGRIELFGQKPDFSSHEIFKRMGTIIEYPIFFEELTAKKNLEIHCNYMGYQQKNVISRTLEKVDLKHVENKEVRELSRGMKQKLGIARAIITEPELLILDEPVNGLDPVGIHIMRDLFLTLSKEYGTTLLISSHILAEVEQIADTIGIIRDGQLIDEVSMDTVHDKQTNYLKLDTAQTPQAAFVLENQLNILNFQVTEKNKSIKIYDIDVNSNDILHAMLEQGIVVDSLNKKQTTLEAYFLQLINGGN